MHIELKLLSLQANMPTTGVWIWKDNNLEFVSNQPGGEKGSKRDRRQKPAVHFPDHGSKRNDRATPSSRAYGVGGRGRQSRGVAGHRAHSSKGQEYVTLNLIKSKSICRFA